MTTEVAITSSGNRIVPVQFGENRCEVWFMFYNDNHYWVMKSDSHLPPEHIGYIYVVHDGNENIYSAQSIHEVEQYMPYDYLQDAENALLIRHITGHWPD